MSDNRGNSVSVIVALLLMYGVHYYDHRNDGTMDNEQYALGYDDGEDMGELNEQNQFCYKARHEAANIFDWMADNKLCGR